MTRKLIRTLACVALGLVATPVSAEGSPFSIEYAWMASLDVMGESAQLAVPDRPYPSTTFMRFMVKSFVKIDSAPDLRQSDPATGQFRRADPEFGIPQAFRQQQQMRLGFSIRF